MSSLLSTFSCCFWWFLAGAILGWLAHWWLNKNLTTTSVSQHTPTAAKVAEVVAAPVAKAVEIPKASAPAAIVIDIAAAKKAGFSLKNANDLTIVEGIGPKINELFHSNGIKTFAQLASATVPQMRAILDKGGARFRIANPSTWAQQAALAAVNKWAELKKLQAELSGGIKK